jgi:hypothetical protein
VVHSLELVGANKDWRAFPELVEMYKMAVPAGKSWSGGEEVTVDTGAEGDADQQAAEAQYKAQNPGRGGGGGGGPSRSSVLRNLSRPIGKCVKEVTGKSFETSLELSEWWVENYIMVAQKIAELEGKNPESVVPRAKIEQAELREKVAKEREDVEKRLAKEAEKEKE